MNSTPRLRSSYPSTPESGYTGSEANGQSPGEGGSRRKLPSVPQPTETATLTETPLIPFTVLDAPSQRFYVLAIFIALLAWRLYDWGKLVEDDADSFWLFIKWVAIDGVFLYGLPGLRIPWLEWSNAVTTGIFLLHAVLNGMLMFRVSIPIEAGLGALVKMLYDRELSVSENRVKPASILHNSSLIMGKQIINVLPEGSVTLNPDMRSFCLDHKHPTVKLPIQFNQTQPSHVELLRLDFDTNANETIVIGGKELLLLRKQAEKRQHQYDTGIRTIEYPVRIPGLYRLQRVLEKPNLEVQRRMSDTLVVVCPKAAITPSSPDRCVGDLSDLTIEVDGTPPMKIVYSRNINSEDQSFHFQSLQPESLASPLLGSSVSSTLVSPMKEDVSWGRSCPVNFRLNESMTPAGRWVYSINEVQDAIGNVANYSKQSDDNEHNSAKGSHLHHTLTVHERPVARMEKCDTRNPLMVASGSATKLPVKYSTIGKTALEDNEHTITWWFSPISSLTAGGDHGDEMIEEKFVAKSFRYQPVIHRAGLYTLKGISSQFCDGVIKEPASCLLLNPPEPDLTISSEDIFDKCAGNSIGLLVDLDLIGTPPFTIRYEAIHNRKVTSHSLLVEGSRHQLELKPKSAGHFTYRFTMIDDSVYKSHSLSSKALTLEQDVKPPASASLLNTPQAIAACIDEPIQLEAQFSGEPPFTLEYELVHDGKRDRQKVTGIDDSMYKIITRPLSRGGEYSLALTSVQDRTGCKIFLNSEVKINVRRQRPKVSFAQLEGKTSAMTLEGRKLRLPLRLEGEAPWTVRYRNLNQTSSRDVQVVIRDNNDDITIDQNGVYQLLDVFDNHCPGTIDTSAATFSVDWISRPGILITDMSGVVMRGPTYVKPEVCEGDMDAIEIKLIGTPPYHLRYQQRHKPDRGSLSVINKEIDAALGVVTISMETTRAGTYTYDFKELSDNAYDFDPKKHKALIVEQVVYSNPSAQFSKPGQSYKYCKEEVAGDEVIPITLTGVPPFYIELDIKHHTNSRPETVKISNIETKYYEFRIPHKVLSLGTHQVSIRKVQDSRGCQQKMEYGGPHVQVRVFDVPTIYALESRSDYCVGDRISYTLSGTPPFDVYYTFGGIRRKAKSPSTNFRRIAEKPGNFTITAVSDAASECIASVHITKAIHEMPSVKISKGKQVSVDIHEGGEAQILFEFWGTPPFEFTYTRSTNARRGQKSEVLETRHDVSHEFSKVIQASQEGTYEVVAIKDSFCAFSTHRVEAKAGQKLLQS